MPLLSRTRNSDMTACMYFRNLGEDERSVLDLLSETEASQMVCYSSIGSGARELTRHCDLGSSRADQCYDKESPNPLPVSNIPVSASPLKHIEKLVASQETRESQMTRDSQVTRDLRLDEDSRELSNSPQVTGDSRVKKDSEEPGDSLLTRDSPGQPSRRRKTKPTKSAERDNPNFVGMTGPETLSRSRYGISSYSGSGSESEDTSCCSPSSQTFTTISGKSCSSCKTRKTPLWRDAEDGTPLCNACGIRYKKYRSRCTGCWHIPHKLAKPGPNCPRCGSPLRHSLTQKVAR